MKKHFLFLALAAICSLSVWAVDAAWGVNKSIAFPDASTVSTSNGISLVSTHSPGAAWFGRSYDMEYEGFHVDINTDQATSAIELTKVEIYLYNEGDGDGIFISFSTAASYDSEAVIGTPVQIYGNGTGAGQGNNITAPASAKSARIYKNTTSYGPWIINISATAEPAATPRTVHYVAGDGTGTMDDIIVGEGRKFNIATPDGLKYVGHKFVGWSDGENTYQPGDEYTMPTSDVTFTAQWIEFVPTDVEATWRYNGTNVLPSATSSTLNEITLTSNFVTNSAAYFFGGYPLVYNYEFGGANNAIDITLTEGLELKNVTTSINFLGGAGSVKIYFSEAAVFDANQLVGDPVTLTGATDQAAETPCSIDAPEGALSARIHQDPTGWGPFLYSITVSAGPAAVITKHTISFEAGGAEGTVPTAKSVGENKTYTLPNPTNLTYEGHLFVGWKTEGDETIYPAGTEMTMGTADVTFTAQWEIDYTATWGHFHSATPLRPFPSATSDVLNKIKITTSIASRTGDCPAASDVCGWGVSGISFFVATNAATDYLDIQFTTPEYIIEKVEASTATGLFNIQYASSSSYDSNFNLEGPKQLPNNNPANIQVIGAVAAPDGARSARITPTGTWAPLYYLKVYAKLAPFFNVTYNAGGASGTAPADDKAYEGTPYTLAEPTELEKTGFVFTGWKSSIDEEVYAAGASLVVTDNVTFTAQWEEDLEDPTITFRDSIYIVDESNLDLGKLFTTNSTGAVTYSVKDAGTTGAAVSGSVFTATASGTAIVTASQARVEGSYNAKFVDATITVKAYAKSADFYAEANSGSPTNVNTFLSQNHYTVVASVAGNPYWDAQQSNDGGLAMTGESTTSFLVKANKKVTIKVGTLNGDQNPREAILTMNSGTPIAIAEGSETSYTTEDETEFVITTYPATTASWAWNRIQVITISDMSPKTVSFNTNGGTPETIEPITETAFDAGIALPDAPAKTNYIFDGWYTAATGGTFAGNAGAIYKPAENCTLYAHWAGYAESVNFVKSAEWGEYNWDTRFNDIQDSLDFYHYTMSPLGDTQWDNQGEESYDAGLKSEYGDREFSFWVPAGKQVTIQLGTWQGGDGTAELDANGTKIADLAAKTANGPYTTTEDTKFVIKIVNPMWSLIQKIDIVDIPVLIIDEAATEKTVLTENLNQTVNVQLVRSLTGGMFNTFCLPFDLNADQIAESDLADSRIITLDNTSLENQTLYFNFVEVETIEAGKPYLIQPLTDVVDPEFSNVTITADEATTQHVELVADFIPSFIVTEIPASESNLFLYLDNTLYYASEATEMLGMRAYFHVIDPQQALLPARMRVGRSTPTGDEMVEEYIINDGTYQANGHVFIIHNGVRYNLFGQKM